MIKEVQVSHAKSAVLGFQHLLAMYAGAVIVPILIGSAMKFNAQQMTYLVSIDIFMCGIATLLQLWVNRFFGIGLPVVLGCAIQAVAPLSMIGAKYGIPYMYGAIISAGIFIVLIAGVFSRVKKLFPPLVTGTVITVIGLSLVPISLTKIAGGDITAKNFGSLHFLFLGAITVLVILLLQVIGKGFIKAISVLIGLIVGTLIGFMMGYVNFTDVVAAEYFHIPQPFYFGIPKFDLLPIVIMILISLVSMVESTGVYFALSDITDKKIDEADLKRGYRAEGLAVILGGIFNTFPYTAFSQNVGLVQLSKIKTTRPIFYSAIFLIILGLLPKVSAIALLIPEPVLGGAMLMMFGMVAMQGIKTLQKVDFSNDLNFLVAAVAIACGLGVSVAPAEFFNHIPTNIRMFVSNGIVISSVLAVTLNLLFSLKNKKKV